MALRQHLHRFCRAKGACHHLYTLTETAETEEILTSEDLRCPPLEPPLRGTVAGRKELMLLELMSRQEQGHRPRGRPRLLVILARLMLAMLTRILVEGTCAECRCPMALTISQLWLHLHRP